MSPVKEVVNGKAYWRSLDEIADTPEFRRFVEEEFPGHAQMLENPVSRRGFLKYMAASMALAGLTSCRWPKEEILPYASRPDGRVPGDALQFATTMDFGGAGRGLLVTSVDGRPIKVEGNPAHPESLGSTDSYAQASILDLYDPDRSRNIMRREAGGNVVANWDDFTGFATGHFEKVKREEGRGLYVLTESSSSPSMESMRSRFMTAFPKAKWIEYEAVSRDAEREGAQLAFGGPYRAVPKLNGAKLIVSFDSDFMMTHPSSIRLSREFAEGRRVEEGTMNRLYVVESRYSVTGGMADHRFKIQATAIPVVVACLAAELFLNQGLPFTPGTEGLESRLRGYLAKPEEPAWVKALAEDLVHHRGESLLLAGEGQPREVHAIVGLLNRALGAEGRTLEFVQERFADRPSHNEGISSLARDLRGNKVDTLLILGGNPAYDAPSDLELVENLGRAKTSIHLSEADDETSALCNWHVPRAHYLESWGDARAWDGTVSLVQPLIEPIFGGKTPIELLAIVMGEIPDKGYDIVRRTFGELTGNFDFERRWRRALHEGMVPGTADAPQSPSPRLSGLETALSVIDVHRSSSKDGIEVVFRPDYALYDGRYANNGWLQELPDPITKLTWDNAALMGMETAEQLKVEDGDLIRLDHDGRTLTVPAYRLPGHAEGSITIHLGYGRRRAGRVGNGTGFDVSSLRTSKALYAASGVRAQKAGGSYRLATTQNHHAIDLIGHKARQSRIDDLVREASFDEYREHPDFARHHGGHHGEIVPLWEEHDFGQGHKWGMSIDLNACHGCGACTMACQAENNIPVVGKKEVTLGREMNWLRVDRYFAGDVAEPAMVHQPMPCQQCENAPCEQVCPVAATTHSSEGLNVMVYNRCIGTRYCSNNCPFKVRRFNYFNNQKNVTELEMMQRNPEVTIRGRGVMEKCTYCIQRISRVKIEAKNERRTIEDGEIQTACQQACPTQAIVFGDLADEKSQIRKMHEDDRAYTILDELYVKPRTAYLAKVRNPSKRLAGSEGEEHGHG